MTENFASFMKSGIRTVLTSALLAIVVTVSMPGVVLAVRAKEFAFYGSTRADWVTLSLPVSAGQPIVWKILKNPAAAQSPIAIFNFGQFNDSVTPGSWTGDATYDAGVWRSGVGYWTFPFENPSTSSVQPWGIAGDNLGREGDYDGDGIMDPTVIRILSGNLFWWIRLSTTGASRVVPFGATTTGQSTFAFRGADFTGDGRDELIIARVLTATGVCTWFIGDAVTGAKLFQVNWGNFNTQFLINPADYTGDGRADIVTWAAGDTNPNARVWWIYNAFTGQQMPAVLWGVGDPNFVNNDFPIRGDYDGDGTHDICVWRPTTQVFWCLASSGGVIAQPWGAVGDVPLANFFTF